jgi:glycosyltransferase involved in cell wall biosynthesis
MAGLAHGCPVVTTSGALTEPIWAETGGVAMSRAGDAEALVGLTMSLLDDPDRRLRLGATGKALYERRFALERTIETLTGSHEVEAATATETRNG